MYCANCGVERDSTAQNFCKNCGVKFEGERAFNLDPIPIPIAIPELERDELRTRSATPYAGFWRRAFAFVVDYFILVVGFSILSVSVSALYADGEPPFWLSTILIVAAILYWPSLESSSAQATFGKRALGLRVTDTKGERLSFWRAFMRLGSRIITNFTFGIGYAMAVFTRYRQTLHDKMVGSLVVRKGFSAAEISSAGPAPPRSMAVAVLAVVGMFVMGPGGIGVLAAIAIPAYQDYTVRAQVADGLVAVTEHKVAVEEAIIRGDEPEAISSEALGLSGSSQSRYVETVDVVLGAIAITFGASASSIINGKTLVVIPGLDEKANIEWICGRQTPPAGVKLAIEDPAQYTTVLSKYLPTHCRESG